MLALVVVLSPVRQVQALGEVETPYTWSVPAPIVEPQANPADVARNVRVTGDFAGTYVAVYHNGNPDDIADPPEASEILVSKSLDIGQTWSDPVTIPEVPGVETNYSFRPDIATDGLGFYMTLFDTDRGIFMSTSDDHGTTWGVPINISDSFSSPSLTAAHSVSLDTDGQGTWIAAWIAQGGIPAVANLVVAISGNNGTSWVLAKRHDGTGLGIGSGRPQVKCDRNTTAGIEPKWIIAFEDRVPDSVGDLDAGYLFSSDGGDTFTSRTINIDYEFDLRDDMKPRVDYETSGTWVAIWGAADLDFGGYLVLSARSSDGLVWSNPTTIDSPTNFDQAIKIDPWISTDNHNNWIALWTEETGDPATEPRDIFQAISYNDGTTWSAVTSIDPGFSGTNLTRWLNPVIVNNRLGKWLAMWQHQATLAGQAPSNLQTAVPWYSTTEIDIGTTNVDLHLTGTLVTAPPINRDTDFVVRFTITNNGTTTASNVGLTVTHNADPAITIVSVVGSGAYVGVEGAGGTQVQGGYAELGPGQNRTVDITYNASQAGTYTFSGVVSSTDADLNLNDNDAQVTVIVDDASSPFDIHGSWYKITKKSRRLINWTIKGIFGLRNETMVLMEDVPVDWYLSVDATFDPSDTLVATDIYGKLEPVKPPKPGKPIKPASVKKKKFQFKVDFNPANMWVIAVIRPGSEPYNTVPIQLP